MEVVLICLYQFCFVYLFGVGIMRFSPLEVVLFDDK